MIITTTCISLDVADEDVVEDDLKALVARALPDVPALAGRWYWDSRPQVAIVARAADVVVGVRFALARVVDVSGRAFHVVGTGVAVDPAWQRKGVGTALTRVLLSEVVDDADDVVIAFLATENARRLLVGHGFVALDVPVFVDDRDGQRVQEQAPCFVRELKPGFVDAVRAAGALFVGRAW